MKVPTHCPICGDPMLNIFPPAEDMGQGKKVTKYCNKKVTHGITMVCDDDEVTSLSLGMDYKTQLQATWLFNLRELWIWEGEKKEVPVIKIPWFEPNFSNHRKLINKLKTYLLFS